MILTASLVKAQNGYLVTLEGDSIFGEVNFARATYYDEVKIKHQNGNKTYKALIVKCVVKDGEIYEPINYNNRRTIAKLLTKGTLSYYAIRPESKVQYTDRVLYKDGEALPLSSIGFRGNAINFLSDCQTLKFKLEERELGFTDIDEIINIYNSSCGKDEETPVIVTDYKRLIDFSQLLFDITTKLENGENVPDYMIDALDNYSDISIDSEVKGLLVELKKN